MGSSICSMLSNVLTQQNCLPTDFTQVPGYKIAYCQAVLSKLTWKLHFVLFLCVHGPLYFFCKYEQKLSYENIDS